MNTLLINLTRFGDLVQTQPVFLGLQAAQRPLTLVCLDAFAPVAGLLRGLDRVAPLPGQDILGALAKDWRAALGRIRAWAEHCAPQPCGDVLNLTPALSARLLARLLAQHRGTEVSGFSLDEHGFGRSDTPWAAFLLTSSNRRGCSPFNLADLLWKAAGLPDGPRPRGVAPPDPQAKAVALQRLEETAGARMKEAQGFVALQLGASDHRRRWPVSSFARIGAMFWEELRLLPVLTGGLEEKELAVRYAAAGGPGLDLTGATTLTQLAATLACCRLLVSNDTGTMHLAAGLGIQVVALFLATAQPWDTGPCVPGAICLEPDLPCHPCSFGAACDHDLRCRAHIPARTVFEQARATLPPSGSDAPAPPSTTGARIWKTVTDQEHFLDLRALSAHEATDRTQWLRMQRLLYRHFLDCKPWPDLSSGPFSGLSPALAAQTLETLALSAQLLELLKGQALLLSQAPRQALKGSFLNAWSRLSELWENSPHFNVLGLLWRTESQESGRDMPSVMTHIDRYAALVAAWRSLLSS